MVATRCLARLARSIVAAAGIKSRRIRLEDLHRLGNYEGFSAVPYLDQAGWWSIGFGRKLSRRKPSSSVRCTKEQAEKWMLDHLVPIEVYLSSDLPKISQRTFDSLCSLLYNVGQGEYAKSNFRKLLKAGVPPSNLKENWLSFCHYQDKQGVWHVSEGVKARRQKEWEFACLPDQKPSTNS